MSNQRTQPDTFDRIPVQLLKAGILTQLERAAFRNLQTLEKLRKTVPEVADEYHRANRWWSKLYAEVKRRELVKAQREPVLWTCFSKESWAVREVQRTEHYTITRYWHRDYVGNGEYRQHCGEATASKCFGFDNPWREFERANKPVAPLSAPHVELAA